MKQKANISFYENRKAYHDYSILETIEAGIELTGMEVKSVKNKSVSLSGSYVAVLKNELWLMNANISGHSLGNLSSYSPMRNRKLLCHRKEIEDVKHKTEAKGLTAIPLKIYLNRGSIKVLIGIARGKNLVDKRETLKNRDLKRNIDQHY